MTVCVCVCVREREREREREIKREKEREREGEGGGDGNGVYSSLFRAKASGGHSKARETRDAQFLQKVTRFALIGVGPARPRPCRCPPPQIPVSQSPF